MVKKQELISLQECLCRKEQRALDKECEFPKETCLGFGNFGRFYIDNKWGKRIDVDQALKILDRAEDLGLVLTSLNTQELEVLCCCCPSLSTLVHKFTNVFSWIYAANWRMFSDLPILLSSSFRSRLVNFHWKGLAIAS